MHIGQENCEWWIANAKRCGSPRPSSFTIHRLSFTIYNCGLSTLGLGRVPNLGNFSLLVPVSTVAPQFETVAAKGTYSKKGKAVKIGLWKKKRVYQARTKELSARNRRVHEMWKSNKTKPHQMEKADPILEWGMLHSQSRLSMWKCRVSREMAASL